MKTKSPPKKVPVKRRIVLVDDHPIVREGLKRTIQDQAEFEVCAEFDNAPVVLQSLQGLNADLIMVDLTLAQCHGIDLIKDLRLQYPQLPILVLSMHEESIYAPRVLRAGARGYLMKNQRPEELIKAISHVLSGEVYLSSQMTRSLLQATSAAPDGKLKLVQEILSDRELQVFEYIGRGYGSSEIAKELKVHVKTVSSHRENIKTKLRARSGHELSRQAIQWTQTRLIG